MNSQRFVLVLEWKRWSGLRRLSIGLLASSQGPYLAPLRTKPSSTRTSTSTKLGAATPCGSQENPPRYPLVRSRAFKLLRHPHEVSDGFGLHLSHDLASVSFHCDLANTKFATDLFV
jgi:hypothetical protein